MAAELGWYALFENHTQGLLLESMLRAAGLRAVIVPTPRALSKSCGMALALCEEELGQVRGIIAEKGAAVLEIACYRQDINPQRDKFC